MNKIGFIGCGSMGSTIAAAVIRKFAPDQFIVGNRTKEKAEALAKELGCQAGDIREAARTSILFIGVTPSAMAEVFEQIRPELGGLSLLISMASGVTLGQLQELAGKKVPVIRMMPNTPSKLGRGMIQFCGKDITDKHREIFRRLVDQAGELDELPEELMEAAAAVSGCGPAFAYEFIEALADGGVACGLPRDKAIRYAAKMLEGSAAMALAGRHPCALKDEVCTPGGSTIQGIRALREKGFSAAVMDAVIAAYGKSVGK